MKAIVLLGLLLSAPFNPKREPVVHVYILNFNHESPVAISEEIFWGNGMKKFMDTVAFSDQSIVTSFNEIVHKFEPIKEGVYVGNKIAIILQKQKTVADTFYTEDFEYFRSREKFFRDQKKQQ